MESSLKVIVTLLNDLRDAGVLEYEFVSPQRASRVNAGEVEEAIQRFASELKSALEKAPLHKENVQIKAGSRDILEKRIEAFLQRKSDERQKLSNHVQEGECARTLPFRYRRIGVEHTCNEVGPSAESSKPRIVSEDRNLEQRISTIESQIGIGTSSTTSLLLRLKSIEDRLLYLESVSPEYQTLK
ncbi:MAP3K12-binding inhibitory protein 1 isoform X2 [Galendromus occidentalis]|uniref:MAP3K12-binding inhibitory protein 1 isoform X2 n=1 Tax=Galendromus occidentalis TaxID=34638 RepID=A0AAJ7SEM7_9ACAR|nr:MAP3K12-binding inhibitory protein 1 isoform X2 [Galendromus occidentalis]